MGFWHNKCLCLLEMFKPPHIKLTLNESELRKHLREEWANCHFFKVQ